MQDFYFLNKIKLKINIIATPGNLKKLTIKKLIILIGIFILINWPKTLIKNITSTPNINDFIKYFNRFI